MKKVLLSVAISSLFLISCNNEEVLDDISLETKSMNIEATVSDNDSIIQLRKEDFPNVERSAKFSNDAVSEMMSQLVGIKVQIQATNYVGDNNTLEFVDAGKELKLAPFSKSKVSQSFYLKVLPATSGIPYMIYTWKDEKDKDAISYPIGVGSYSSAPQNYVVYAKDSESGGLFGFSWDFKESKSGNGLVIENQDIIGQGGGGWMDIYYYSMNAYNNILSMAKTNYGSYQEFTFIPDYQFEAEKLEFFYDEAKISNADEITLKVSDITNSGGTPMTKTFTIEETRTDNSTFNESKSVSITSSSSSSFSIGIPEVISFSVGGSSVQSGETQSISYQNSVSIVRKFTDQLTYEISPYFRTVCRYIGTKCALDVPYKITYKVKDASNNLRIAIRGVWKGVDYYNEYIEKKDYSLDNPNVILHSEIIRKEDRI